MAIAAALLAAGGLSEAQVHAPYFAYGGSVLTYPTNVFPIDVFLPLIDATGNTLAVGSQAVGSFSVLAGGTFVVDSLAAGTGGTGTGSVSVGGAGATLTLRGTAGRLDVGSWGVGSLAVSGGGLVDAASSTAGCSPGSWCGGIVGNAAGSTGTLSISGAGSEVRAVEGFTVGQAAVYTQAGDGFVFGTPGGTTNATVALSAGGTLRTEGGRVGVGPETASALGTERAFGNVTVDGAGSRWIVTRNSIDNAVAFVQAGVHANGTASIRVSNGGQMHIDGSGSPGPYDGMNLGVDDGRASLTVTGAGSSLVITGNDPILQVGRSGAGQSSFGVLAGATASMLFLNVGRDGATGSMTIDGTGSTLSTAGAGTPGIAGAAFASIGNAGTGTATVSNGGRWVVTDAGADTRPGGGSPGIAVGRGANASGSLTITGAGSTVEVTSTSLGLGAGVPDNYNPFVAIGYDNAATTSGALNVANGGKLLLTGNAASTVADPRDTGLYIGARPSAPSTGSATVTGAGSEIKLTGNDAIIRVGRGTGSTGTLNILDQARVSSTSVVVGENATGLLAVDHATLALSGYRTDVSPSTGAGMTVGRGTGASAAMTLSNGARLTLANDVLSGGLSVGGDAYVSGGVGSVALSGGSSIQFSGSAGGALTVGRSGVGTLTLDGASSIAVGANRSVFIGREAGGTGSLVLRDGSSLSAGYVGVGATQSAAGGSASMIVGSNSSVTAQTIEIGARGYLGGNGGTLNGRVINNGTLNPGESPGRIIVNGGFEGAGTLILEIAPSSPDAGGKGSVGTAVVIGNGFDVDQLALGTASTFDFSGLHVEFHFLGAANPNTFSATGGFDLDNFLLSSSIGGVFSGLSSQFAPGQTWANVFASSQFSAISDAYAITNFVYSPSTETATFNAAPIPEPATWLLTSFGLLAILGAARRRGSGA